MKFKNDWHEELFNSLVFKVGAWARKDREYCAALYALAATEKENILKYADPDGIEFDDLLKAAAPWSSGEKALVSLAAALFNYSAWSATINDVFYNLDGANVDAALEALRLRYK